MRSKTYIKLILLVDITHKHIKCDSKVQCKHIIMHGLMLTYFMAQYRSRIYSPLPPVEFECYFWLVSVEVMSCYTGNSLNVHIVLM